MHGSTGGTRRKVWTRTKISLFGGRALHLPSLRSPVEEAQAGLLLLREEVASLRSIFLSMTSQGHLASLMPASAGTCASRGSASRQSRCAFRFFSSTSFPSLMSSMSCKSKKPRKVRQKKKKNWGWQLSSWQMFFLGGGKCPNLGVVNVRILGVVNVLLANDSQSKLHYSFQNC